jgi:hypothetical protein
MAELTTDKIYNTIVNRAIDAERGKLYDITSKCYKDLGLESSGFKVKVETSKGVFTDISVFEFNKMLVLQLIEVRSERISSQAVKDFVQSVNVFKTQMSYLEQYDTDHDY